MVCGSGVWVVRPGGGCGDGWEGWVAVEMMGGLQVSRADRGRVASSTEGVKERERTPMGRRAMGGGEESSRSDSRRLGSDEEVDTGCGDGSGGK
jgi:hypothetical protein